MNKRQILNFLAEKQSFSQLYKKFKGLKKEEVSFLLNKTAETFSTGIIFDCYVDGAAQPNPGPAGAGVVIYRNKEKVKEISEYLGKKTNNQAEYTALLKALDGILEILEDGAQVRIFADSMLMVKQVNGYWRARDSVIAGLLYEAKKKIDDITGKKGTSLSLTHISRAKNKVADALSVLAIKRAN